jgi:hypothetical protein
MYIKDKVKIEKCVNFQILHVLMHSSAVAASPPISKATLQAPYSVVRKCYKQPADLWIHWFVG